MDSPFAIEKMPLNSRRVGFPRPWHRYKLTMWDEEAKWMQFCSMFTTVAGAEKWITEYINLP